MYGTRDAPQIWGGQGEGADAADVANIQRTPSLGLLANEEGEYGCVACRRLSVHGGGGMESSMLLYDIQGEVRLEEELVGARERGAGEIPEPRAQHGVSGVSRSVPKRARMLLRRFGTLAMVWTGRGCGNRPATEGGG